MTKPHLLPVFVDGTMFAPKLAAKPEDCVEAIVDHCLLLNPDCDHAVRIALRLFANQAVANYEAVRGQNKAWNPSMGPTELDRCAAGSMLTSLRIVAEPQLEREALEIERNYQQDQRQERIADGEAEAAA